MHKKVPWKEKTLSQKIIHGNGLIICLAFSALLVILEAIHAGSLTRQEKKIMEMYLNSSLDTVDNRLKDMGRVSLVCFSDKKACEILENYEEYDYIERLNSEEYLHQLYTSLISIRDDISGIYMFDEEQIVFFQDRAAASRKKNESPESYIVQLRELTDKDGNISGCHFTVAPPLSFMNYLKNQRSSGRYLYLMRSIKSFSPYRTVGYIVISSEEATIRKIMEAKLADSMFFCLLAEDGQVVSSSNLEDYHGSVEDMREKIQKDGGDSGNFWDGSGKMPYLLSFQKSAYSGMTLVTGKPAAKIYDEVKKSVLGAFIVFAVLGAAALVTSGYYTRRTLKKIMELSAVMSNFNEQDLGKKFEVVSRDEAGRLMLSFNRMQDMILNLIEEKYKNKEKLHEAQIRQQRSSLLYLKSQINPHFLYNTLDTIRIKAELNGDKEVACILMQLVRFFRLNVKADMQLVTIWHEVELIQAYMNLMCCRYENLRFECEVEEGLEEIKIPNFLLQPLIENSILNGLKNCNYSGLVRLTAERVKGEDGYILIKIYDNGIGLDEKRRQLLKEMLEEWKSGAGLEQEERHIGVSNVQMRIKMYYSDDCGLSYLENPEGGVTALIRLKTKIIQNVWEEKYDT